ncbi:hypothetical protein TNCV_4385781 [Trichonephila clavipes]|nr:hypothetical protein TNCV_4385781 [Trichonephila clavipes]
MAKWLSPPCNGNLLFMVWNSTLTRSGATVIPLVVHVYAFDLKSDPLRIIGRLECERTQLEVSEDPRVSSPGNGNDSKIMVI